MGDLVFLATAGHVGDMTELLFSRLQCKRQKRRRGQQLCTCATISNVGTVTDLPLKTFRNECDMLVI